MIYLKLRVRCSWRLIVEKSFPIILTLYSKKIQPTMANTIVDNSNGVTVSAHLNSNISVSSLPQETLDFAAKVFNLARNGGDELLSLYLNAGLPPNLTNEKGEFQETLRICQVPNLIKSNIINTIKSLFFLMVYGFTITKGTLY